MPSLGVVLDTNVLLSGLAYPASVPGKLIAAWRHGALNVVLSPHILEEVRRTLPKLNHRHGLTPQDIHDLIEAFTILAEVITPDAVSESKLRDAADRPVLGTLLVGRLMQEKWSPAQGSSSQPRRARSRFTSPSGSSCPTTSPTAWVGTENSLSTISWEGLCRPLRSEGSTAIRTRGACLRVLVRGQRVTLGWA